MPQHTANTQNQNASRDALQIEKGAGSLLPAAGAMVFMLAWGAYTVWACYEIVSMTLR